MAVCTSAAQEVRQPAQTIPKVLTDSTEIRFRQSSSKLDLHLDHNGERLDSMLRHLKMLTNEDSAYMVTALRVIGSASPEGSIEINRNISLKRARSLFDYFADKVSLPSSITDFEFLGRNWKGLYSLVKEDADVPYRNDVLALLQPAADTNQLTAHESNHLLVRLKRLKGGVPYAYLYRHLFPALRYSYLYVEYEKLRMQDVQQPTTAEAIEIEPEEPTVMVTDAFESVEQEETLVYTPEVPKNFYMALKTNMLYDIAAVPNIGAEFYVGKNISVLANWMYSWWDNNDRHRYWRIYGGELGLRWWFGHKAHEKPLTGHHLGVYGGILTFDFEWGGKGYMGGKPGGTLWDRCMTNAGVEYGYSLPIGSRLNIDFSIGVGYLGGNYIKYFPFDNEYFQEKEYKMRYFGPTKAEISLVWLLGRGNRNVKKGGAE